MRYREGAWRDAVRLAALSEMNSQRKSAALESRRDRYIRETEDSAEREYTRIRWMKEKEENKRERVKSALTMSHSSLALRLARCGDDVKA